LLAHFGSYYSRYSTASRRRPWPTDELLAAVGLAEHADKQIKTLSGGQRRRLDVAVGLVGRPELLFLDEPTAGFDPQARRDLHELIQNLVRQHAITILLTTHDLHEADRLADRIVVLDRGRIIADGAVPDLARQIVGPDEVRWTHDGQRHTRHINESTRFVIDLVRRHGESITDLEVHRSTLEDTYLSLVRQAESSQQLEVVR
jgi:ABC-2 type transport system ATP-binding protein